MWRRSSVVRVVDELARAQRRDRARADVEQLVVGVLWTLWSVRLELALLVGLVLLQRLGASVLGDVGGNAVVVGAAAVVLAVGPARQALMRLLRAMSVRRAWARATIDSGVAAGPFRCPAVRSVGRVPAGDVLRVRVRRGQSVADLDSRGEHLAACLRARELRVLRDPRDAAQASVLVVRRDPFEDAQPARWPMADLAELSLWAPIPVGVDEQGRAVTVELVERNMLIGGEP